MLDSEKTSFVAYFPLPVRYGLTIGELAQLFNAENHINVELHVIRMKNWHRSYFFESTGIRWIPPSPNLRTSKGSILVSGPGDFAECRSFCRSRNGSPIRRVRRSMDGW